MSHTYDSGFLDWYEEPPDPRDYTGWFDDDCTEDEKAAILDDIRNHPSLTAEQRNPSLR